MLQHNPTKKSYWNQLSHAPSLTAQFHSRAQFFGISELVPSEAPLHLSGRGVIRIIVLSWLARCSKRSSSSAWLRPAPRWPFWPASS
ncbi:hypothetical protein L596_026026 [Steinernema carpocapsae]|uniref:Uncharacterized protein n=1 Tax=Steinernema carpocapsae TaxID=34508 RepID=A0A4U5M048_STECR|nr:hypothetical protein L596_026026 [Steinernema carpocapsae]